MKAILYHSYGSPDILRLEESARPVPGDNEVLLRVRAASANPLDWHFLRGQPYAVRLIAGLPRPKDPRLGVDMAGVVEAVGGNVSRFQPGDEVFGAGKGAFAEFACAPESALTSKPPNLTFEQAAGAPIAAMSALQGLRTAGRVESGSRVLINGAAGGVGTFAVQIAKSQGAQVTGVCSSRNVELVMGLGADRVIDYSHEDFTQGAARYDVILDCVGNHSLSAIRRVLQPGGTHVPVGGRTGNWMAGSLARSLGALVLSRFGSRKLVPFFLARMNREDLDTLRELLESAKIKSVIDRRYQLVEVPEAIRYLEEGHARGKVVITVD
jgi:NADPH:quinone reductase-like Zn-dependent oxidoreductase